MRFPGPAALNDKGVSLSKAKYIAEDWRSAAARKTPLRRNQTEETFREVLAHYLHARSPREKSKNIECTDTRRQWPTCGEPARPSTLHQEIVTPAPDPENRAAPRRLDRLPDFSEPHRSSSKIFHRARFSPKEYGNTKALRMARYARCGEVLLSDFAADFARRAFMA